MHFVSRKFLVFPFRTWVTKSEAFFESPLLTVAHS